MPRAEAERNDLRPWIGKLGLVTRPQFRKRTSRSPQFRVLSFGLLQDWNVWICVFPQCEEILVGSTGLSRVSFSELRRPVKELTKTQAG
jgi:hypothetical protein